MILIEKDKLKYYDIYFGEIPKGKYEDVTNKNGLLSNLRETVVFGKGLTFRVFFNHLLREKLGINVVFKSSLGYVKLEDYIEDINKPYKEVKEESLSTVQVAWRVDFDDKNEFDISCDFLGVGEGTSGNRENANETAYALDLSPLGRYADLPFKLNKTFIIEQYNLNKKSRVKKILKTEKEFTLFEVIDAVLYEITWHGHPSERDKRFGELKEQVKQIEEDRKSGKIEKYKTLEEFKEEMDQSLNEKSKNKKN